jgi:hypothetical protein
MRHTIILIALASLFGQPSRAQPALGQSVYDAAKSAALNGGRPRTFGASDQDQADVRLGTLIGRLGAGLGFDEGSTAACKKPLMTDSERQLVQDAWNKSSARVIGRDAATRVAILDLSQQVEHRLEDTPSPCGGAGRAAVSTAVDEARKIQAAQAAALKPAP